MMKTLHLKFGRVLPTSLLGAAIALPLLASPAKPASFSAVPVSVPVVTVPVTPDYMIQVKAGALGAGFTGNAVSGLETVPGGFRIRYEKCDIYYSAATGAHEVHGGIRDKYNAKGGPFSHLGLPLSDELATSDGIGRYNEFSFDRTAIYWSPNTGPFEIGGDLRSVWVANGAEAGRFGYPTTEARYGNGGEWTDFQNDVIYREGGTLPTPVTASLTWGRVSSVLYNLFGPHSGLLIADLDTIGYGIDSFSITDVSDTGQDFLQSRNRLVTLHVTGDFGPAPLPSFRVDLQFLFYAAKEADGSTSLWMRVARWYAVVTARGLDSSFDEECLRYRIEHNVAPARKLINVTIPAAVNVLSFKVLPDGGIKLYLQPGGNAQQVAQQVQLALNKVAQ